MASTSRHIKEEFQMADFEKVCTWVYKQEFFPYMCVCLLGCSEESRKQLNRFGYPLQ